MGILERTVCVGTCREYAGMSGRAAYRAAGNPGDCDGMRGGFLRLHARNDGGIAVVGRK